MNGRVLGALLVAGVVTFTMLSCSRSQQSVNGQVGADKGAELPPGIKVGATFYYGTASGGTDDLSKPNEIKEIRGRWIRVEGGIQAPILLPQARWVNLDQITWYSIKK